MVLAGFGDIALLVALKDDAAKVVVVQVVFLAVDAAGFADDMLAGAVYPIDGIRAEFSQGVACSVFRNIVPTSLRLPSKQPCYVPTSTQYKKRKPQHCWG
ncbi:hypothetical protein [Thalassolituus sp.]|uniref:hypothetical protein n=1 Tax=Thalassolituus sp. TaxID=2030822 RepID=UPI003516D354